MTQDPWGPDHRDLLLPDDANRALVALAAAVVAQAFRDLVVVNEQDAPKIRKGAYIFLTRHLWEPGCIWYEILSPFLVKRLVLEAVELKRRYPHRMIMDRMGRSMGQLAKESRGE